MKDTKVPTVREYAFLSAKEQKLAGDIRFKKLQGLQAEKKVLETRLKYAQMENEAYPFKVWALLKWPEPHKLGAQRLQAIHDEMDGK